MCFLLLVMQFVAPRAYGQHGICDTAYWNHTYANQRLKIYDSCYTIRGKIQIYIPPSLNGDGDYHIYVQPDSAYQWMTSYRDTNYVKLCEGSDSSGYLICPTCLNVEEICKGAITDGGAEGTVEKAACLNFNDTVYLPNLGEYVQITGPFVYDTVHCWNELHPVSSVSIVNVSGVPELDASAFLNSLVVYPQPGNNRVNFRFDYAPNVVTLIKIYDESGRQLFVYALSMTNTLGVDVSTWPNGEYLYKVEQKGTSRLLKSGKFVVMH